MASIDTRHAHNASMSLLALGVDVNHFSTPSLDSSLDAGPLKISSFSRSAFGVKSVSEWRVPCVEERLVSASGHHITGVWAHDLAQGPPQLHL